MVEMNKTLAVWIFRSVIFIGVLWFAFWIFIWEPFAWNKTFGEALFVNPLNTVMFIGCVIVGVASWFIPTTKTKSPITLYVEHLKIIRKQIGSDVGYIRVILIAVGIIAFTLACVSLIGVKLSDMGSGEFFIEKITPLGYWIGITVLMTTATIAWNHFSKKESTPILFIFLSALLLFSVRMLFAEIFTNPIVYEPDVVMYDNTIRSWTTTGIDFGVQGNYQHDFPMAFLIAYSFVKLGVPLDVFLRYAPVFVSLLDFFLIYLILNKIDPQNKTCAATSVFIFAFSSLGYWIPANYCPQSIGTVFYFLSLYLTVSFAKKGTWTFRTIAPLFLSIFFLILSHHLSTLYFVLTLLGFAVSIRFFSKDTYGDFRGKEIIPFIVAIFAYSFWFLYGNTFYPLFFNFQKYFSFQGSISGDIATSTTFDQITAIIYPLFVSSLFLYALVKSMEIRKRSDIRKIFAKLKDAQNRLGPYLVYSFGFVFIAIFCAIGLVIAAVEPFRLLEITMISVLPISSQALISLRGNPSRKKEILLLFMLNLILITSVHRYYRQIQRRVINW